MAFAGRAGEKYRANAVGGEKGRLSGDDFRRDAAVGVKRRMDGSDEMIKTNAQTFLLRPSTQFI